MRAGLAFVIAALLIGQGFREWRRRHEERFQDIVRDLSVGESHDVTTAGKPARASSPDSAPNISGWGAESAATRRRAPVPRGVPVGRIDPNRASGTELERLPGIGPALAARIVTDRDRRGLFPSPEALLRVPGIGPRTLERIRAYLSFPAPSGGDSLTGF